jgi:hypothetical protein
MDLPALAEMLRSKGRNKDTILAHINPREAALLKRHGGSGTINPDTGLPQFDDGEGFDAYAGGGADQIAAQNAANQAPSEPVSPTYDVVNQQGQFTPTQADTGVPVQVGQSYTPGGDQFSAPGRSADVLDKFGQTTPYTAPLGGNEFQQASSAFPTLTPAPTPVSPGVISPSGASGGGDKSTDYAKLAAALGLSLPGAINTLGKAAVAAPLGVYAANQAKQGAQQIQAAQQQQQNIAQPYQTQGQNLVAQSQAGQLSPSSAQAYQAAQARLNQDISNRGGVGAQQAAAQEAAIYQTLLDNQYKYGLNVMQIGDNISLGAIKTGLQLDQQLQTATTNFYTNLASIVAGGGVAQPQRG